MNGRAYDYNLGRFLSVDPFIQEPGNSQSMNPYSYIMNNPLAGTDPSGYLKVCDTFIVCSPEQHLDENFNKPIQLYGSSDNGKKSAQGINSSSEGGELPEEIEAIGSRPSDVNGNVSETLESDNTGTSGGTKWNPKYLKLKGVKAEELSNEELEVLNALDQTIFGYRDRLLKLTTHEEYGDQAKEALNAFDETSWEYHHVDNDDVAQGSLSWSSKKSFNTFKKKYKRDKTFFNGDRTVKYFKGIRGVYKNGLSSLGKGSIVNRTQIYDSIPDGVAGLKKITYHEASHTIVSKMYDGRRGQFMKQWGRGGFEVKADKWAKIVGYAQ